MTGNAVFIDSDEHGVVVFLAPIHGLLTALIDEFLPDEGVEHLPIDAPLLEQIGIHPAHGLVGGRQLERLGRLRGLSSRRGIGSAEVVAQQHRHGFGVANTVILLHKADGSAALFGSVVEPLAASDGDAVVAGKALIPAGGNELLTAAAEKLLQVHRGGPFFLFFREWNEF